MKVLVIIGELQKVTDKFDSAVACITDILSKLGDAQDTTVICVELKEYGKYAYRYSKMNLEAKKNGSFRRYRFFEKFFSTLRRPHTNTTSNQK